MTINIIINGQEGKRVETGASTILSAFQGLKTGLNFVRAWEGTKSDQGTEVPADHPVRHNRTYRIEAEADIPSLPEKIKKSLPANKKTETANPMAFEVKVKSVHGTDNVITEEATVSEVIALVGYGLAGHVVKIDGVTVTGDPIVSGPCTILLTKSVKGA